MKNLLKWRKPSPALIVAIVALSAALVGTAVAGPIAGISLSKGEKKQIRKISRNIANRIFNSRAGQLVGPQGVPGPQGEKGEKGDKGEKGEKGEKGDTGSPGSAVAYGTIEAGGAVEQDSGSHNLTNANVQKGAAGIYCFSGLPAGTQAAIASASNIFTTNNDVIVSASYDTRATPVLSGCPDGTRARVRTFDVSAGELADASFNIWFED